MLLGTQKDTSIMAAYLPVDFEKSMRGAHLHTFEGDRSLCNSKRWSIVFSLGNTAPRGATCGTVLNPYEVIPGISVKRDNGFDFKMLERPAKLLKLASQKIVWEAGNIAPHIAMASTGSFLAAVSSADVHGQGPDTNSIPNPYEDNNDDAETLHMGSPDRELP